jgi:thiol-disulfide isomerase/thioredoxin
VSGAAALTVRRLTTRLGLNKLHGDWNIVMVGAGLRAALAEAEGMAIPGSIRWTRRLRREVALVTALCVSVVPAASAAGAEAAEADVTRYSSVYVMDPSQIKIGTRVPAFKARGLFGKEVDFEALVRSGRPVILAFWSKYCKACVEKFSALVTLQTRYGPQGLQVISVNTDGEYREGEATIREFLGTIEAQRKITINFPVIYDDRNWIPHAMGINFLPTIIAVDTQGLVLDFYQKFDEAGEAEILAGIEALVKKVVATAPPVNVAPAP